MPRKEREGKREFDELVDIALDSVCKANKLNPKGTEKERMRTAVAFTIAEYVTRKGKI